MNGHDWDHDAAVRRYDLGQLHHAVATEALLRLRKLIQSPDEQVAMGAIALLFSQGGGDDE